MYLRGNMTGRATLIFLHDDDETRECESQTGLADSWAISYAATVVLPFVKSLPARHLWHRLPKEGRVVPYKINGFPPKTVTMVSKYP